MRTIDWFLETGMVGGDREGEIEVEDDATVAEIEEPVRERGPQLHLLGLERARQGGLSMDDDIEKPDRTAGPGTWPR